MANGIGDVLARAGTGIVWLAVATVGLVVLVLASPFLLGAKLYQRLAGPR